MRIPEGVAPIRRQFLFENCHLLEEIQYYWIKFLKHEILLINSFTLLNSEGCLYKHRRKMISSVQMKAWSNIRPTVVAMCGNEAI